MARSGSDFGKPLTAQPTRANHELIRSDFFCVRVTLKFGLLAHQLFVKFSHVISPSRIKLTLQRVTALKTKCCLTPF